MMAEPAFPDDIPAHPFPIVDYELIKAGDEHEIDTLWGAATELGFWYLKNHGAEQQIEEMFDMGDETMQLPLAEKMPFEQGDNGSSFGYKAAGVYATDEHGTPDNIEFLNVSADDAHSYPAPIHRTYPQPTTARMPGTIVPFVLKARAINATLLSVLGERLALPSDALASRHAEDQQSYSEARYIRSPPMPGEVHEERVKIAAHTDIGSLTFLSNRLGGLQVLIPGVKSWQYIKPLRDHLICNIGDALMIFSGGILRSSAHRVVSPPPPQSSYTRNSVVFLARPNNSATLRPLAAESPVIANAVSCIAPAERRKYDPGVTIAEWYMRRVSGLRLKNRTVQGPETWCASRGVEHTPQTV